MKSVNLFDHECIFINGVPYCAQKEGNRFIMVPLDDMVEEQKK